jgi:hypothetical protein
MMSEPAGEYIEVPRLLSSRKRSGTAHLVHAKPSNHLVERIHLLTWIRDSNTVILVVSLLTERLCLMGYTLWEKPVSQGEVLYHLLWAQQ